MPNSPICLDANVIIQALVNPQNAPVQQKWRQWSAAQQHFVAPSLQRYEVTNVLHRYQYSGHLSVNFVERVLQAFLALPIAYADTDGDYQRAMELARQFHRPAAYDTHYLALAERLGVEFWTADQRLASAVRSVLPWVHVVGSA